MVFELEFLLTHQRGCHQIHQFMSGRIKLLKDGVPINSDNDPPLDYKYDVPSSFDENCGTYGLEDFQLPHPQCPETFVCGNQDTFSTCLNAMNCRMFIGMTTGVKAASQVALFIHQYVNLGLHQLRMHGTKCCLLILSLTLQSRW